MIVVLTSLVFPKGSVGKGSTCRAGNTGGTGSIPGPGRSPGEGKGKPLLYSCFIGMKGIDVLDVPFFFSVITIIHNAHELAFVFDFVFNIETRESIYLL